MTGVAQELIEDVEHVFRDIKLDTRLPSLPAYEDGSAAVPETDNSGVTSVYISGISDSKSRWRRPLSSLGSPSSRAPHSRIES